MVDRGLLHVKKHHARRWDYFLTPTGIAEKARLTYEFLDFSLHFYQDARKASSAVCKELAESGVETVSFLGAGDLAEIVYLGVKEWDLTLDGVFDDRGAEFLGHKVLPISQLSTSKADAILVCLYDKSAPTSSNNYLPDGVESADNMRWIFDGTPV
jgi:hypothetical protein